MRSGTLPRAARARRTEPVVVLATGERRAVGGRGRRLVTAAVAALVAAGGISALSLSGRSWTGRPRARQASPAALARRDARAFLARYVDADGRVVRRDQGGTTVSEGQAYALLLSLALGDRTTFGRVWRWERDHLQLADGLFAYRYPPRAGAHAAPATDADLDTAWALVAAGRRWHDPAYRTAGARIASAVLADETVPTAHRTLELAAGPWARTPTARVNPSYLAPEAMTALADATGAPTWRSLRTDSTSLVASLERRDPTRLPPDWATLGADGVPVPAGPRPGSAPAYGLTAQRVAVWYAADCAPGGRRAARALWPTLRHLASHGARISYGLDGRPRAEAVNPVGEVAAAAAAAAAGQKKEAAALLARADRQNSTFHTYYGAAWVALGRVLLDTTWLSGCPPA